MDKKKLTKGIRRLGYFVGGLGSFLVPRALFRLRHHRLWHGVDENQVHEAERRVRYYVRLPQGSTLPEDAQQVRQFSFPWSKKHRLSAYVLDLFEILRYFPPNLRFCYIFGDVNHEPDHPCIVKSRPVPDGCSNAAVMKLDKLRHFNFIEDTIPFRQKKDMAVFRNAVFEYQPHREMLLRLWQGNPLCDFGQINPSDSNPQRVRPFMSQKQQLHFKFIMCIEGNDVATNLKWVMSSNSVAVMPRPRFETWYMEGMLIPGRHYIEIAPDYHDLEDKLRHYIAHPELCEHIIQNAHEWVGQFTDKRTERLTSFLTLKEYFRQTSQL